MQEDFFSQYLSYTSNTEPPAVFHRWALIAGIGAYLGRQYYFDHGHFTLHPNHYCMLIGSPGTRKSTSIKLMKKLLIQAGYTTIAADKTTKEKFILDLSGETDGPVNADDILDKNLFGELDTVADSEIFIMADEFNDFFGNGNIEFISLLGTLWDYSGIYRNRIKNGKSVSVHNPTISILGGNTPTGFSLAFPTDILGQGFFSRILLIYGEPNGKRITFPKPPDAADTEQIVGRFKHIKSSVYGCARLTSSAESLIDKIYQLNISVDDVRFESYSNRRLNHLLKLCLIVSASRSSAEITERDVRYANTILTHAEQFMPKALGEFGKAKNSGVVHKVMQVIHSSENPIEMRDIWKHVYTDLDDYTGLSKILNSLVEARKIQYIKTVGGFLPIRNVLKDVEEELVDYSLLTPEEREMKK